MIRRFISIAVLALVHGASAAAPVATTCHLPGSEEALRCLNVAVKLDASAKQLALHVTVAPAFREAARSDPLFVIAGGPGQAGSDVLFTLNSAFRRVRATRDIVFIDQRGTGLSGKLDCEVKPEHETMSDDQLDAAMQACIARIKQPFAAYTTAAAARDIEQVRLALGYGKINVWGGSYGTRLAQVYARAFPASVRAIVLDGVAAPDQVIPAGGRDAQAALQKLFDQCAADKACNKAYSALRSEFTALTDKVAGGKVAIDLLDPRTAQPAHVEMSSARFLGTVHGILYSPIDSRRLPFLIHSASQGHWEPFIARRNAGNDYAVEGGLAIVMHLAVTCAEDFPRLTPALLAEDAGDSSMVSQMLSRTGKMCATLNVPAVPYVAPARIEAPVLLLSGAMDPVTPPRRAETAAKYIAHAQHFVVANAGHGISTLGCAPRLLREFLDQPTASLAAACLKDIPAPTFQLSAAGPQP
ncbi:MAG: alpha/beta hydrolase [Pseudomonadota bacterium]